MAVMQYMHDTSEWTKVSKSLTECSLTLKWCRDQVLDMDAYPIILYANLPFQACRLVTLAADLAVEQLMSTSGISFWMPKGKILAYKT